MEEYGICRVCFMEIDENRSLPVEKVANMIMMCASVKIGVDDGLPGFVCELCTEKARQAFNFRILCEESDMYLRSSEILKVEEHDLSAHESEAENKPNDKIKEKYNCRSCSMVFYYKKPLIKHERKHKEGFRCKDCGKNYASAKHLAVHISIKKRKGSHLCQICGKAYTMPENLKRHQRVHNGFRPFICKICDKSFTQSNELKSHLISHSSEKTFLCSFCGNKYARERSLQVHITRIHSNVATRYTCTACGRVFKGLVDMKIHQTIHVGNKDHVCKVCSKAFNKSSNLKVHERIHTGQRPFVCQICQKSFIQKHVLNKHLTTHAKR